MSWERPIDAAVERVWEVVTQKEHRDGWFMATTQTELRVGGAHRWFDNGTVNEF